MLSFKPAFSLSSFTLIKRLFNSYLLSAIRVASSIYLRLLLFLPAILIPACNSSRGAFRMMYSAYRLNKLDDNKSLVILLSQSWTSQLFHTGYCFFLTHIQVSQETGKMICYSHFFKSIPQFVMIYTVKGFGVVDEMEVDVFLQFSCFLNDPANVANLISGSSIFSKSSLYIWKFLVHVLLKPNSKDFEHYLARM